jgi:hypothetical protein
MKHRRGPPGGLRRSAKTNQPNDNGSVLRDSLVAPSKSNSCDSFNSRKRSEGKSPFPSQKHLAAGRRIPSSRTSNSWGMLGRTCLPFGSSTGNVPEHFGRSAFSSAHAISFSQFSFPPLILFLFPAFQLLLPESRDSPEIPPVSM